MNEINPDVKIRLVTDEQELKDKGHDAPVIELYNDVICSWVSSKDMSFNTIDRELRHISKVTELYISKMNENKNNWIHEQEKITQAVKMIGL